MVTTKNVKKDRRVRIGRRIHRKWGFNGSFFFKSSNSLSGVGNRCNSAKSNSLRVSRKLLVARFQLAVMSSWSSSLLIIILWHSLELYVSYLRLRSKVFKFCARRAGCIWGNHRSQSRRKAVCHFCPFFLLKWCLQIFWARCVKRIVVQLSLVITEHLQFVLTIEN